MGYMGDVVTAVNERVFLWKWTPAVYAVILMVGLIVRLIVPLRFIDDFRGYFSEDNFINVVFGNHAYELFTILWLLVFFMRVLKDFTRSKYQTLLPISTTFRDGVRSRATRAWHMLVVSLLKYTLTLLMVVSILEIRRVIRESYEINISGHYIAIVTLSVTALWEAKESISDAEILKLDTPGDVDQRTLLIYSLLSGVLMLCFVMLMIWCFELLVTAIFYHTVVEKVIGLGLGYVSPVLIYKGLSRVMW